ncbi:MAG: acetyl-CoA carboxylase biotin carboxyl carrier protein [bacterium]|nr:acetyl-CoA carboxylase biotin carboxyl carrier protein [bacterium]
MNLEKLKRLLEFMEEHDLQEMELKGLFYHIKLRKAGETNYIPLEQTNKSEKQTIVSSGSASVQPAEAKKESENNYYQIRSPMVGTFYRSPSPGAEPYVKEGDIVKKGQVLCIIEAMKVMNEIESDVNGRIVKVLVENGKPVEYNQPLFLVDTNV